MIQKITRMFRNTLHRKPQSESVAAIYLQAEQLKLVVVQRNGLLVRKSETVRLLESHKLIPACVKLAQEVPKRTPLCLVLSPEHYQLLQLDKPSVPAAEIQQALPWQIRDLVTIPPEDMVVDYCDVAEQSNQAQPRIQVVVSSRGLLAPLCKSLQNNNITLQNIQPDEWLARNLLPVQPQAVLLLSHQPGQDINIQIVRDGMMYVSRKLRGFNRIDLMTFADLRQGLLDNLLLEVQRSLDYFEGQLRQAPVKEILFLLATPELGAIVQYFVQNGFTQVRPMDLSAYLPGASLADQGDYWLPLAGALELLQNTELSLETTH